MPKKILIVDDDISLAEILGRFLITFGYPQAAIAHDGGEGLLYFEQNPETLLVFTDLRMPNVDGLEFIRKIRKKKIQPKIIIMSGEISSNNDDDLVKYAKQAWADAAIQKPFIPHEVMDALALADVSPKLFQ